LILAPVRVVLNAHTELRKPKIGAQFVSFNFTNALICAAGSSARRIVSRRRCRVTRGSAHRARNSWARWPDLRTARRHG